MLQAMDARDRLILTAERLVAEQGVDVALRDVALAAGQRNNSAVHYHFGSRDGLLRAVLDRRNAAMEEERLALLAEHEVRGGEDGVSPLLDILVRPLLTVPYAEGSTHYARFLERVRSHPVLSAPELSDEHWPAVQILTARLNRAVAEQTGLSSRVVRQRMAFMASVMFALLADVERERDGVVDPLLGDEVVTMLVGLLTAVPVLERSR